MQNTDTEPERPPVDSVPGAPSATRVERAVARLAELDSSPLSEHPGVYDAVHAELRAALAEVGQ